MDRPGGLSYLAFAGGGAGVFTASGENMQNYGVPPDVLVDNTPADFVGGHDRQIEKAIETLRAQK